MKIAKIRDVKSPARGTQKSAGIDFYIPNDFPVTTILPQGSLKIPSGIHANVPEGFVLIVFNKSGIALKGLQVGACVIDEDYQGEMNLHVYNHTSDNITIEPGTKLVQMILLPVSYDMPEEVSINDLYTEVSERGEGGFGSTGLH
jgi:dUTP pyrophosphatase